MHKSKQIYKPVTRIKSVLSLEPVASGISSVCQERDEVEAGS